MEHWLRKRQSVGLSSRYGPPCILLICPTTSKSPDIVILNEARMHTQAKDVTHSGHPACHGGRELWFHPGHILPPILGRGFTTCVWAHQACFHSHVLETALYVCVCMCVCVCIYIYIYFFFFFSFPAGMAFKEFIPSKNLKSCFWMCWQGHSQDDLWKSHFQRLQSNQNNMEETELHLSPHGLNPAQACRMQVTESLNTHWNTHVLFPALLISYLVLNKLRKVGDLSKRLLSWSLTTLLTPCRPTMHHRRLGSWASGPTQMRAVTSVVSDSATPWTVACQAPLSMGFSRQEYWSGLPCPSPRDLPNPGFEPVSLGSPALAGEFFTTSATWEAHMP